MIMKTHGLIYFIRLSSLCIYIPHHVCEETSLYRVCEEHFLFATVSYPLNFLPHVHYMAYSLIKIAITWLRYVCFTRSVWVMMALTRLLSNIRVQVPVCEILSDVYGEKYLLFWILCSLRTQNQDKDTELSSAPSFDLKIFVMLNLRSFICF